METKEYRTVDKSAWGNGEWQDEPDKIQWLDVETGLPCLAVRHSRLGHWCGYVGLPEGHPLYGKDYNDFDGEVHGGLTFAGYCGHGDESRGICHVPGEGEPDSVYWLGFDCGHAWDLSPGMRDMPCEDESYRDLRYVRREVEKLAAQLKAAAGEQAGGAKL